METAFLIFNVPIFSYKIKDQMNYPRKIYSIDTGLRNVASFRFMEDQGKLYENVVAVELKRRGKEFYYWKDDRQREVDFVIKEGLKPEHLIQVCYDFKNTTTKQREIKALASAMNEFKINECTVITENYEAREEVDERVVIYKTLWKWLLE